MMLILKVLHNNPKTITYKISALYFLVAEVTFVGASNNQSSPNVKRVEDPFIICKTLSISIIYFRL